jgi:hypothetical protein
MKLAALLALVLTGCGCSTLPDTVVAVKPAAFRVEFADGICSAAAVGPTTILIATHCLKGAPISTVGGREVTVLARTDDGKDHSLLRLNIAFDRWARIGRTPVQGEDLWYYGNPMGLHDMLRKGYVAGTEDGKWLMDVEGAPGDSGAAVFDRQGRVIGVVSEIIQPYCSYLKPPEAGMPPVACMNFRMMAMYPLAFTRKQWAEAES